MAEIPDDTAVLAFVHNGREVSFSWFECMMRLTVHDSRTTRRVSRGGVAMRKCATDGLGPARNVVVRDFLDDFDSPWLMWIDTDMGFAPDTVDRLIAAADPIERPVVGGLCFAQREIDPDGMGGYQPSTWPVLLDWDGTGFLARMDYIPDTVTKVDGAGSACILVHRSVFEQMREAHGGGLWQDWYSRTNNPVTGDLVSEDLAFCLRLMEIGVPIHVDTSVKTTHHKPVWLSEHSYIAERTARAPAA